MSRPPAQYQAQTPSYARVVNGGLIDFRDNTVRGNCDYPVYPNQIQQYADNVLQPALGTPGCIQGPPSYLHINGVTYKPVSDDVVGSSNGSSSSSSSSSSGGSGIDKSAERSRSPDPAEIERLVDTRVREKVDSYMSKITSKTAIKPVSKSAGKAMSDQQAARAIQQINQSMASSSSKRRPNPSTANW